MVFYIIIPCIDKRKMDVSMKRENDSGVKSCKIYIYVHIYVPTSSFAHTLPDDDAIQKLFVHIIY